MLAGGYRFVLKSNHVFPSFSEPSLYFIPYVAILHGRVLMDLLEIGAIAQVLGAVAILLSLIFVIMS